MNDSERVDAFFESGIIVGTIGSYDPFGNPLGATSIDHADGNLDYGWHGQAQRPLEHQTGRNPTIEMGARPYQPSLGRLLATDPIEGGTPNDYMCTTDPNNQSDLDRLWAVGQCFNVSFGVAIVVSGSICGWFDQSGRTLMTWSGGIGMGFEVASGSFTSMYSNVTNVKQLTGWAACGSVGAANGCVWTTGGTTYYTAGAGFGAGAKVVSGSATSTYTGKLPSWMQQQTRSKSNEALRRAGRDACRRTKRKRC